MKFFSTFSQKYLEVIKKAVSLQRFREIEHIKLNEQMKGRLAQLVQSICLTSRGSAVRIRQRPQFFLKLFLRLCIVRCEAVFLSYRLIFLIYFLFMPDYSEKSRNFAAR